MRINITKYAKELDVPYCLVDTIRQTSVERAAEYLKQLDMQPQQIEKIIINYAAHIIREILKWDLYIYTQTKQAHIHWKN